MVLQIHSNTTLDDLTLNQSDLYVFINKRVNLHSIQMEPCEKKVSGGVFTLCCLKNTGDSDKHCSYSHSAAKVGKPPA